MKLNRVVPSGAIDRGATMEVYMTELEMKVDAEVGNDTEHQRMTLLKYVNYGRRLEREATGNVSQDELKSLLGAQAKSIIEEFDSVMKKTGEAQAEVELVFEDEALAKMPKDMDLVSFPAVMKIVDTVDAKHTEIIKTIREPGFAAIRAKYLKDDGPAQP